MNKKKSLKWHWFVIIVGFALLAGCEQLPGDEDFYEIKIPPGKLRHIETLDLEQAKAEENDRPDVNQAPPKEIEFTLEQCRALTLANNLDIKVQLISPAIAAERVSEEEAKFEAAFYTNTSFTKTDTPTSTRLAGSQVDYSSTNLGVQVPLRTGGTLTFDIADRRVRTDAEFSAFSATLNPEYSSDFSISISQPLLRRQVDRPDVYNIRIATYERQIADARTKLEVIRVIAAADRVYWRLYAARRELDVRKQEYDLAKKQLESAQRFVDSGERAQVEITRAEAGVAQRLEAIIIAENNVRDREREFKRTVNKPGLDMQTPTVLVPATEPDPILYELSARRLVAAAVENRMEMLELELQIAEDISTMDYMRNLALPLVTLDYTYNINGLGATRSDAFDLLSDKNFEDHRFGLQLLVPLGNEAAKSRLRQAFYQRRQRLATRKNRSALIEIEVLNAIDKFEANWQRILAGRQNAVLAARLYRAEKRQFELGLRTSTEVLDAQTQFADAQRAEILALTEYQIALVDLAYATGTLLGAAKVQWAPVVPISGIN